MLAGAAGTGEHLFVTMERLYRGPRKSQEKSEQMFASAATGTYTGEQFPTIER
jgi:hypothetical protein